MQVRDVDTMDAIEIMSYYTDLVSESGDDAVRLPTVAYLVAVMDGASDAILWDMYCRIPAHGRWAA